MGQNLQKDSKHAVVVTIHLGCTHNAYAFKFQRRMGRIHLNPNWGSEMSSPFWMTPNCLLYNRDGSLAECFGIKAELEYFTQLSNGGKDTSKPVLYRQFKKQLHGESTSRGTSFDAALCVKSFDGTSGKTAVEVFADALKNLKEKVKAQIEHCREWEAEVSEHMEDNTCWVISMPDIWNKSWKSFIREAAVKAGLITKMESKSLLLPLESQCASLLCRQLTWDKFLELNQTDTPSFQRGVVYMIVNVEDEYVTVSVHHIDHGHDIEEVIEPIRSLHDGKFIYSNLCDQLSKSFGEDFLEHLKEHKPYLLWEIMRNFSVALKNYQDGQTLHLKIHLAFAEAFKKFKGARLSEVMSKNGVEDGHISLSAANGFAFTPETVREIVGNIAYDVQETVHLGMQRVKDSKHSGTVSYVFFVGELVDWKLVQDEIRNIESHYQHKPMVLIPPEAALSVIRGAILYGQHQYKLKKKHWSHAKN